MNKYVFIDENMNVKSFTRFVNEAEDETERKRELKRTSVEDMLKPYGEFSDTARRVLEVAVKRGVITNRQRPAVYPCYRAQAGSNSYIFYDAETGRIMEIVKPVDKSAWHIRFGDKFADDKPNAENSDEARRTTIATLKSNFESMYSMWEDRAVKNMDKDNAGTNGKLSVSTITEFPIQYHMLTRAIAQMREWVDLSNMRKTTMPMEDFAGKRVTIGAGYTNVKNEPVEIIKHERALGPKGYLQWYERNIGKLAATSYMSKEKETKKSKADADKTIGQMIVGLGLLSDKFVAKYNNDELLRLFNSLIQENPYASTETKKKWRETLKSIYQKTHNLTTEDAEDTNENYYGAMLYDPTVKKAINNPENREGYRKELLSMLTNFYLASVGLRSPDITRYSKGKDIDPEMLKTLPRTSPPRGGFKESLIIPSFVEFIFEGTGRITYVVSFSGIVDREDLLGIDGVIEAERAAGTNTWEITSDYGIDIRDGIYDFAFDKGLDVHKISEKDAAEKTASGETFRKKAAETMQKKLYGDFGQKRIGAEAARLEKWASDASKFLKSGVYVMNQQKNMFEKIIFDASSKIGAYIVLTLNPDTNKYGTKIVPTESHIGEYTLPHLANKYVLKTDEGYVAYGVPAGNTSAGGKAWYYSEQRIQARNVKIYDSIEDAEAAAADITTYDPLSKKESNKKPIAVEYQAEEANQMRERYFKVKEIFDANAENTFYVSEEEASKAYASGNRKAKSTDIMSSEQLNSFLEGVNRALYSETAKKSGIKAEQRHRETLVRKKSYGGEYENIGEKNPKLAKDIEEYGTDPSKIYDSTPGDYLIKAAEIINNMRGIGVEEPIIRDFVGRWIDYAGMALELENKKLENTTIGNKIDDDQIEQVKNDIGGDTVVGNDKVQYMLTMAFMQLLVRELGAVHIQHALTKWKSKNTGEDAGPAGEIGKYLDSDVISRMTLPDLWEQYDTILDEMQGNGPDKSITDARRKLIDITIDALKDVEVEPASEDNKKRVISDLEDADTEMPLDLEYNVRKAIIEMLSLVTGKGTAALYKTQMRNVMHALQKKEA